MKCKYCGFESIKELCEDCDVFLRLNIRKLDCFKKIVSNPKKCNEFIEMVKNG